MSTLWLSQTDWQSPYDNTCLSWYKSTSVSIRKNKKIAVIHNKATYHTCKCNQCALNAIHYTWLTYSNLRWTKVLMFFCWSVQHFMFTVKERVRPRRDLSRLLQNRSNTCLECVGDVLLCNRDSTMVTQTWFDCVDDGVGEEKKWHSLPHHHTHLSFVWNVRAHTYTHKTRSHFRKNVFHILLTTENMMF